MVFKRWWRYPVEHVTSNYTVLTVSSVLMKDSPYCFCLLFSLHVHEATHAYHLQGYALLPAESG